MTMKVHNTSGQEELIVANSQVPVTVLSTPILDWYTLYAQNLGDASITLPFSACTQGSTSTTTACKYVLTRRLVPSDLSNVISSVAVSSVATTDTAIIDARRFFLDESLVGDLLLAGTVRARTSISIVSSTSAASATLTSVTLSLRKLTAADTYTTIGSSVTTLNLVNNTTTAVQKSVVATIPVSPEVVVTPSEKLCLEVTATGKSSTSAGSNTLTLFFTAGTSSTYIEAGV